MIKEAIGYVNKIVHLTENIHIAEENYTEENSINESPYLPDIHLNYDSQNFKKGKIIEKIRKENLKFKI